jgi:hypothetical protein
LLAVRVATLGRAPLPLVADALGYSDQSLSSTPTPPEGCQRYVDRLTEISE